MKKNELKAENIAYPEDVYEFIVSYFSLDLKATKVIYHFDAASRDEQTPLIIERESNEKPVSINLSFEESEKFCISLLGKFNIDWRAIVSLELEILSESIPVFKISMYPLLNALSHQ